jgi:hypothetical protein
VYTENNVGKKIPEIVNDTLAVSRIEKIRYIPLTPLEIATVHKLTITLPKEYALPPMAGSIKERNTEREYVNVVPLSNYKVSSRRVDPNKVNNLINQTAQNISNYFDGTHNLYAAAIIGGNASFGNPAAMGLQLGIAALYNLGERLTLSAEFKFINHFFSNFILKDDSVSYNNISSQQIDTSWTYKGTQYTTTQGYKVNSFITLELPILLEYNLGRVSIFGGPNLAYELPVNWSKQPTYNTAKSVEQTVSQNQNPFANSNYSMNTKTDFAAHIGLGYIFGATYDFSKKLSLDARMTQILMNDRQGNDATLNRLMKTPTLQLSLDFFFGRKEKVIYIMERK